MGAITLRHAILALWSVAAIGALADTLPVNTLVTFTVDMNGAITTEGHLFDANDGDTIWINGGGGIPWYVWFAPTNPAAGPAQYQMFESAPGSGVYSNAILLSKGWPLAFEYKYGVAIASLGDLGPRDNEAAVGSNHFRVIRSTATGTYTTPQDRFGNQYHEPFFNKLARNDGQLKIGAPSGGNTLVSWLGRPGAHLQTRTNVAGDWQDLIQTDGTNWTFGTASINGFVSQTNWPAVGKSFFRLTTPNEPPEPPLDNLGYDDVAFWSSSGTWNIGTLTNDGPFQWTTNFTLPASYGVIGDSNGDGYTDLGEVQRSGAYLYWFWNLNNGLGGWNETSTYTILGLSGGDLPCAADFNGDGKTDLAAFRNGMWYIAYAPCNTNTFAVVNVSGNFGLAGDVPVPGDFNGDGVADLAVFRPARGAWYVSFSGSTAPNYSGPCAINGLLFGLPGDIPAVGDVDGDGYADMVVYRPSNHQVLVNLHRPNKPTFQGYGNASGWGSTDLAFTYPGDAPASVAFADVANSRPKFASMPSPAQLGVTMPGWSCIFDNSLNVPQWANAWSALGINQVQLFSWMRAHEEINPLGPSWNTWVGDERIWTSKAMMASKIVALQAIGAKAVCYAALYAATPAFAFKHPAWRMLDPNTRAPLDYGPGTGYLYMMCINGSANHAYTIAGVTYTNYAQYLVAQATAAQRQFNWDGWRWDWYGIPEYYVCDALTGTGNFPSEIGGLVNRLNLAIKSVRSNCVVTALQLPGAYGNIPLNDTAAVVDQQFLEIWPSGTGSNYSDIYRVVNEASAAYGDKPASANFYPQDSSFPSGWTKINIDYQFATCLSAGGYPGAQLVDGTASFTKTIPMSAVRYPETILARIAQWNSFVQAYAGYYHWSNPTYLIRDPRLCIFSLSSNPAGVVYKAKERRDKRTFQTDTVIVDLINYGPSGDLRWDQVNSQPLVSTVTLNVTVPSGFALVAAYFISPDLSDQNPTPLTLLHNGNTYTVTTPPFTLFSTVVFTTPFSTALPPPPSPTPTSFPSYPFRYDTSAATLNGSSSDWPILDGVASPLELGITDDGDVSSWSFSTNSYYGPTNTDARSVEVAPSQLLFTSTSKHAIRCSISNFNSFQLAVNADQLTTKSWFGFRLLNPQTSQLRNFYYRLGDDQANLSYKLLSSSTTHGWQLFTENLFIDVTQSTDFGPGWATAVVTGVILGPVAGGHAYYDALRFIHN
jgi:hypothetical protein